jgi:hypothetical protein
VFSRDFARSSRRRTGRAGRTRQQDDLLHPRLAVMIDMLRKLARLGEGITLEVD